MNLKIVGTAVACFSYGVLVGWAWTSDRSDQKLEALVEDRENLETALRKANRLAAERQLNVEDLKLDLDILQAEMSKQSGDEAQEDPGVEAQERLVELEDVEFNEEVADEARTNLKKIIEAYTSDEAAKEDFAQQGTKVVEHARDTPPFVIDQATFAWDEEGEHYDKVTLTYFEKERTLLDEDEDVVLSSDVESMIGWRNLNQFGGPGAAMDTVYIRNRRLDIDYEVVRETDEELPLHVKYGLDRETFEIRKAAGLIRFREEDV